MQSPSADLDAVLAFVTERITQEAERSAAPLDDDEQYFLSHLPAESSNLTATWGFNTSYEEFWREPVLRDFRFERLCEMARNAHLHDRQARPDAARECEFADAVLELHRHPMSWLLGWAGIRTKKRRARWDLLLLVTAAVFLVTVALVGALALSAVADGQKQVLKWALWAAGACIYGAMATSIYVAVQRLEARQQERNIEMCRCDLPVRGSTHTP